MSIYNDSKSLKEAIDKLEEEIRCLSECVLILSERLNNISGASIGASVIKVNER